MSSKLVTDSTKLGSRVAAATRDRTRNQRVTDGVLKRCSDVVPQATTSLTLEEAQLYVGRQIEHDIQALRAQDNSHLGQQVEVNARVIARDQAATDAYGLILDGRRAVEVIHGPGAGKKLLGLDTEVPTDPVRLYQTGERCRKWLLAPGFQLPEHRFSAFSFAPAAFAEDLGEPLGRLGSALDGLADERRFAVDSLVAKLEAMKRLDRLVGQGARFLESLYDVAGMTGESDRIRLSSHQRGTVIELPESPEETVTDSPADASPADETGSEEIAA